MCVTMFMSLKESEIHCNTFFMKGENEMAEIVLKDGTVVTGKFLYKYVSFEGDTRCIFYVEGRGEIRCVFENYQFKEYVA